jgi:hypothetical protein
VIRVSPRARRHEDRAGDPLDGMVNLFDLGIVLSVGFLLAALSALNLSGALTGEGSPATPPPGSITVPPDAQVSEVPTDAPSVIGQGEQVGEVYRLDDGRLVYVVPDPTPSGSAPSGEGSLP